MVKSVLAIGLQVAMLLCSYSVFAQKQNDKNLKPVEIKGRIYIDVFSLPTTNRDTTLYCVNYSLSPSVFTFYTKGENTSKLYQAEYQVLLEAKDTNGVIRFSKVLADTVRFGNFDSTVQRMNTIHKDVIQPMPYGSYTFNIELIQNQQTIKRQTISINAQKHNSVMLGNSFVLLTRMQESGTRSNLGNAIPFGAAYIKALFVGSSSQRGLTYTIKKIESKDAENLWSSITESSSKVTRKCLGTVGFTNTNRSQIVQQSDVKIECTDSSEHSVFYFDVPVDQLAPGKYSVTIKSSKGDSSVIPLEVIWNDIPNSMRNIRYASEMMYYVMNDEEHEDLKDANEQVQRATILKWWKKQDPTPSTVYNEKMNAYFMRVDSARDKFITFLEPDGARTERGKIFILFGSPQQIQSVLTDEGGQREIWTYTNSVRKKVYFESSLKGVFRVVKVENLE